MPDLRSWPHLFAKLLIAAVLTASAVAATVPSGFIEQSIGGSWNEAAGITFDANGRMYVWERPGKVWFQDYGSNTWTLLLDIGPEVGAWNDHGLLGFALDPNFLQTGYIYLLYVVDRHHLMNFGTGSYNPSSNDYFTATIGRITRYTANAADGFRTVNTGTRTVLLGETRQTGFPMLMDSHGVGSLVFGEDGTLLASCGDAGGWTGEDTGSLSGTYYSQALADGIIRTNENVGSYRAQMLGSLNGKVVRLDPATGNGVSSNPYYEPGNPRSPRSRVWALGLRNPYRMTLKPESGSHNPADGNPGVLCVGDVGSGTWEELDMITGPGQNFGWPGFEGLEVWGGYYAVNTQNRDVPNPFFGVGGCTQQYLYFNQLLKQDSSNPVTFTDSCGHTLTGSTIPRFVQTRPVIDWRHGTTSARTGIYDGSGNAAVIGIGAGGSPIAGSQFSGACSVGGVWYMGTDFPAQYQQTYFLGDYVGGWIRCIQFGTNNRPVAVSSFLTGGVEIVGVATHPISGGLYYIAWPGTIYKISYAPGGNFSPTAVASVDQSYGPGPLTVQFTGSNSIDPEGLPLTYGWNFGDGSPTNTMANPAHTFTPSPGVPTKYTVTLTVRDSASQVSSKVLVVSANNTPPSVTITNPLNGAKYTLASNTVYNLRASVADAEFPESQLQYFWQTILHHNTHEHLSPTDTNHLTSVVIAPAGCDGNVYYYRIVLTVTDPAGLSGQHEVRVFPNCASQSAPVITWSPPAAISYGTPLGAAQLNATASVPGTFEYIPPAGTVFHAGNGRPLSAMFVPTDSLNYSIVLASNAINVLPAPLTIRADDKLKAFGAPLPAFTATYMGLVNGDTPVTLQTQVALNTSATSNSPPGSYPITATGASDPDYGITHQNGTLTVLSQLPPTIVLTPTNFNFSAVQNGSASNQFLTISNGGPGTLNWTATIGGTGATWLAVSPAIGTNNGTITLSINTAGLGPGTFNRTIVVAASGASNSPRTANVTLTITPPGTAHYDFNYPDRASLLAAGWDFLARTAGGANRNTETTSGAVVSYNQPLGVLRIPADIGDLWLAQNNTRNSIFRDLPTDWTSVRIRFAAFAPTQNYEQAGIVAYQNDDVYVQVMRIFEIGQQVSFAREAGGSAVNVWEPAWTATTNLYMRMDRNPLTSVITGYYSANGTSWTLLSNVTQALTNPRFGIIVTHSPSGFPNADVAWAEIIAGGATSPLLLVSANTLNFSAVQGNNPTNQIVAVANGGIGTLNWTATVGGTGPAWLSVTPAGGTGNSNLTVSASTAGLSAGIYNRTITVTATGASNSPQVINATLTVQPGPLLITWSNPAPIVYGSSLGSGQLNASANVPGAFAYNPPAGTILNASNGQVLNATFTPVDTTNYSATNLSVAINVLKAALTVTAQNKVKGYGAVLPPLTASYLGFTNGDTPASLDTPVNLGTSATPTSPVAVYPITASGAVDTNYTITHVDGALTIAEAPLTISADNKTNVFGAPLPALTASYSGFVNGDTSSNLLTSISLETIATPFSPIGEYPIFLTGGSSSNYVITRVDGLLTITTFQLNWIGWNETNGVTLQVVGPPGGTFGLQKSSDLLGWSPVDFLQNPDGSLTINGENPTNDLPVFFRGIFPPGQ